MTTVLVVDDSTANRRLLHTLLSLRGHDVLEADNGGQALAIARQANPEIVVADVFAARAGGPELVRELREDPQTAGIPVVAYGCDDTHEFGPVAERYHVDRVVPRTSDPGPLLDAIESLITGGLGREGRADAAPGAPAAAAAGATATGSAPATGGAPAAAGNPTTTAKTGAAMGATGGPDNRGPFRQGEPAAPAGHPRQGETFPQMEPFRQVLDVAPVGVVLGTATGHARYVNPTLAEITGIPAEDLLGTGWLACVSAHRRRQVMDAVAGTAPPVTEPVTGPIIGSMVGPLVGPATGPPGGSWAGGVAGADGEPGPGQVEGPEILHYQDRVELPGGRSRLLDVHLRRTADSENPPGGFAAFVVDMTDTVRIEERRHAEWERHARYDSERAATRMESLRRFAGSVAHGYNNALAVILSYGEFLRERVAEGHAQGRVDPSTAHDLNADLNSIMEAGHRAAHLTQQLQSFGHRGRAPAPTVVVDLNAALTREITTLRQRLGPDIVMHLNLAEGLRPVVADPEQVGEIIRNLTENALDAMPAGGDLLIETAVGDPAMGPKRLAQDGHVRLTVGDTGQGMPPNVAQHAIEPFFSTKPDSPGGGLGLTAVYGVAHQSGGDVIIESTAGVGTSVHVLFPVATPTSALPPGTETGAPAISETILVVDDEEPVRRLVHRILTKAGYQVLTAEDAAEALAMARSHTGPVHCLITDLAMPGLPGTELTRRLRAERPELAVLYMSGYAEPLLHHVGNADNRTNLLPKPFSRVELLTAVRATIHEHRAGRPR